MATSSTSFVAGRSGNPSGRAPRVVEDATQSVLVRLFDAEAEQRVILAMIAAACGGDVAAFKALYERKYGRVVDKIEEKSETIIRVEYGD
jgi:hypothetical protein